MELTPDSMMGKLQEYLQHLTAEMAFGTDRLRPNVYTRDLPPRAVEDFMMQPPSELDTDIPPPNIQTLPDSKDERWPFIIVRFLRSMDNEEGVRQCEIDLICGVEGAGTEGQKDVLHLMEFIRQHLLKNNYVDWGFRIVRPLGVELFEEQADPYYMGLISTNWEAPSITTEVRLW